jgi:ubiquitin-protein ligase
MFKLKLKQKETIKAKNITKPMTTKTKKEVKKPFKLVKKELTDEQIILNLEQELEDRKKGKLKVQKELNKISDKYSHLQYDWIKQRHKESLEIIDKNISAENEIMADLLLFYELEKKGIIAEVCIDNFVSRNLKFYPDKSLLLLEMVKSAALNDIGASQRKVYNPHPSLKVKDVSDLIGHTIKLIINLIESKHSYDDLNVIEKIGFDAYKIVKFTLYQTQEIDIKPSTLLSAKELAHDANQQINRTYNSYKSNPKHQQQYLEQLKQTNNVEISTTLYEIIYQDEGRMQTNFYFHGSPFQNWYSIINNGLYVPKSHQILHGSAYGVGIYLANHASTSLGYMGGYTGKCVMGIAQVNNPKKYDKGGFLVVTQQEDVRLKYIIVFENNQYTNITSQATLLTQKLTDIQLKSKAQYDGGIFNKICIKRINKELKQISELDKIYGFPVVVSCDEKEMNVWTIIIDTPKDKWGRMTWEIRFDNDYPVKPPFIRIVKPHFKYLSGHITIGGAFCNPILTNQKWRASISIGNLIEMLIVNMEEGGAQLDATKNNKEYSLEAAKKAYMRYKVAHGWD